MTGTTTPEMLREMDRFRRRAIERGIPPEDVERWLGFARPCADLSREGDGPVVGHAINPAMLPPGPVPRILEEPKPLIACLDLAALPEESTDIPLPTDGHLLLLGTPALDAPSGAAVYVPGGTPVEERQLEYDYPPDHEISALDFTVLQGELRLKKNVSLPSHDFTRDGDHIVDIAEHPRARELQEVWEHLDNEDEDEDWCECEPPYLQIGGYAWDRVGWGDPVLDTAQFGAGWNPEPWEREQSADWLLLAEWPPSSLNGLETTTLYWVIRRQDLVEQRFDRVLVSMQGNP